MSMFYLGPYISCLLIIYKDKQMMSKPYYLIVVNMAFTDIIQLVFNGITAGVFTMQPDTVEFWINKVIGGIMNFCWVMYCFLAHALAFNRFVNVFWPLHVNRIFSIINTKILIFIIWVYGLAWLVAYMCPGFDLIYISDTYHWDYGDNRMSRLGWLIELINDMVHAVAMIVWYSLIFAKLKLRNASALHQTQHLSNIQRRIEDRKELKVLLQAFFICVMVIFTIFGFFAIPFWIPNKWATFGANVIWLGCAGNNAIVYFIFNSTLRKKAKKIFCVGPSCQAGMQINSVYPVSSQIQIINVQSTAVMPKKNILSCFSCL